MEDIAEAADALKLPENLDIAAAEQLVEDILARRGAELVLDAGEVQWIGAQSMQVLLSTTATWLSDSNDFRINNPSSQFLEAVELIGISPAALAIEGADN